MQLVEISFIRNLIVCNILKLADNVVWVSFSLLYFIFNYIKIVTFISKTISYIKFLIKGF